jgi:hypothetical protein
VKKGNIINKRDYPVCCNSCGRELKKENGILMEDVFEATKEWGYFSSRDTQVHHFFLCEECYDRLISGFRIPIEVKKKVEVL